MNGITLKPVTTIPTAKKMVGQKGEGKYRRVLAEFSSGLSNKVELELGMNVKPASVYNGLAKEAKNHFPSIKVVQRQRKLFLRKI